MNLSETQLQKVRNILKSESNFHPADYYNKIMNDLSSSEAKMLARDLDMSYKNKRSFAKSLISIIETLKNVN